MFEEKTVEKNEIFKGKLLTLRKDIVMLKDSTTALREFVITSDASGVLALDENGDAILVKQYRYAHKKELVEIPTGRLNLDETFLQAAKRELFEETGFKSKSWEFLCSIIPSAYSNQKIYIYLAKNAYMAGEPCPDEGEFLEVLKYPVNNVFDMVLKGDIKDAKTVAAILKFFSLQNFSK